MGAASVTDRGGTPRRETRSQDTAVPRSHRERNHDRPRQDRLRDPVRPEVRNALAERLRRWGIMAMSESRARKHRPHRRWREDFVDGIRWSRDYDVFQRAIQYAAEAHEGTHRKGRPDMPYISHPMEAAMIARTMTDDPEVLAAAALHDVVEDTPHTMADIEREFGERIAGIVGHESEDKQADEGRRDRRLGIDPPSERGKRTPEPGKGG